jgi:hypothetical protein
MAQADSVPTPIPRLITDAKSKASTKRPSSADRVDLIGALDADETTLLRFRRKKRDELEPDQMSANLTRYLNGRGTWPSPVRCPWAGTSWLSVTRPLSLFSGGSPGTLF